LSGSVINIYGLDGKIVSILPVNNPDEENMNLSLHKGFYFVQLKTGGGDIYTEKLIVK
jgi:hypothetical protein